jgi:hypothetical protein
MRRALVILCVLAATAHAQQVPARLVVGIYAPSIEFGTAQARLAYVQGLAKAIEQNTGIKTEAQSYATIAALEKDNVDFAIVDAPCVATNNSWHLLAAANVGGGTNRPWALFSAAGGDMHALEGKKLAFIQTGCNDAGFIDNAMLESEVGASFFGARVGKPDLAAAVSEVASYKAAQALFAPVASAHGLTKVFDTGSVPNPAFVAVNAKLPAAIVDKVGAAITSYGGSGAIASWVKTSREPYQALAARFAKVTKLGVFANPEPVRIDAKDALIDPPTLRDAAMPPVRHLFVRPPGDRMD